MNSFYFAKRLALSVGLGLGLAWGSPAAPAKPYLNVAASASANIQAASRSPLRSVRYRLRKVCGVACHVIDVNLNCKGLRVHVERASDMGTRHSTFGSMIRYNRPLAAVTGTFFDTRSGEIICNLVRQGHLLNEGRAGNTIWIDPDNQAHLLRTAQVPGRNVDWSQCECAISAGPTLLRGGRVALNPHPEGFRDPGLFRRAARTGLGITKYNHLLMVTVNRGISLRRFAWVMRKLGSVDALNLDGGSSTAMYYRGHFHSRPARKLTNLVMVSLRPRDPIPHAVWTEVDQSPEISAPPNVEDYQDQDTPPNASQVIPD
jgi:hypothetical protein